ncbi:hypothetical protein KAFR_0J02780 [Kazachstania africana CBS 2517]|uniref:Uncharacterized protein n=1 Tax=Kazachstania africana (strain ATCC 22294 / BCRC 22015 / CBS 2517 / CECT 1963 / NBRC 1671 / NRRL Y-8276) TaxID=1071382 RepID=H2B142_KAZAF|nr:hypothetical protein KAFR_0J02780 [Kazachstania africana CBS 2517]CCF60342.1 hypothetical protein KAFR_0J02780 [Kazachstania africana CBS 2517]
MSFWTFGFNGSDSSITKILHEYMDLLYDLHCDEEREDSEEGVNSDNNGNMPGLDESENVIDHRELSRSSSTQSTIASLMLFNNRHTMDNFSTMHSVRMSKSRLNDEFITRIVNESDLLGELSRQNKVLIDFLCFGYFYTEISPDQYLQVSHIDYLIDRLLTCLDYLDDDHIYNQPRDFSEERPIDIAGRFDPESGDYTEYMREVTAISDIFTSDNWILNDLLVSDKTFLNRIWSLIQHKNLKCEKSPQLSIFLKLNRTFLLLRRNSYLNFIRGLDTFVDDFLNHIDLPILTDFFIKIIATDKPDNPTGILELLYEQDIIPKCIRFFDNEKYSDNIQLSTSEFLRSLLEISSNVPVDELAIGPNILIRQLASPEIIEQLISTMINQRGSALCHIVSVVIDLIRKNNSDYCAINLLLVDAHEFPPSTRDPIFLGHLLKKVTEAFSKFCDIILEILNDDKDSITLYNQLGHSFKPIGMIRIKITELLAELIHCSNIMFLNSRQCETIELERDAARNKITQELNEAIFMTDTPDSEKLDEYNKIQELDETFHIPYINSMQNVKLRKDPTLGDMFKIKLFDLQILPKLFSIFLRHPWNNIWHTVIFDIVQQIFNGRMDSSYNSFLVYSLFYGGGSYQYMTDTILKEEERKNFNIIDDFILQAYKSTYKFYDKHNTNLGYMGHVILISEEILKFSAMYKVELISPDIEQVLSADKWHELAQEILHNTRLMSSQILGGGSYVDDGNGNLIPQFSNLSLNQGIVQSNSDESINDLSNAKTLTELDLHNMIGRLFLDIP